jgi:hypothetical protein
MNVTHSQFRSPAQANNPPPITRVLHLHMLATHRDASNGMNPLQLTAPQWQRVLCWPPASSAPKADPPSAVSSAPPDAFP